MKRKNSTFMRTAMALFAAFLVTTGSNANPIDITFSARGEATTVESVTVTNLTHADIQAVTLNGTVTLRLVDQSPVSEKGDVNSDNVVDVADVAAVLSVMAGNRLEMQKGADVNGDGIVDVADVAAVLSFNCEIVD